jgi:glycosyltransferase involved in cell wall biosynthesis
MGDGKAEKGNSFQSLTEVGQWIVKFRKNYGHPPCMLHIGNIANNAYNNAKLLNKVGFDCDVICYDYYHIMGCPEWEDADFEGEIKDQFFPDWKAIDLNGFKRPPWFAQGSLKTCIRYLCAWRKNHPIRQRFWWWVMIQERSILANRAAHWTYEFVFAVRGWAKRIKKLFWQVLIFSEGVVRSFISKLVRRTWKKFRKNARRKRWAPWGGDILFNHQETDLIRIFKGKFPQRADKLGIADLMPYRKVITHWKRLFQYYDLILAYSTDPILPMLAEKSYFALEHGTLREIPFESTSRGRLTALSYSLAECVFVTNADCVESAKLLAGNRFALLNHPYDEDHGINVNGWQELRKNLMQELDGEFLFFFPTRHDWVKGTGYADKANDIFLRAFASLRREGLRVGMVCCRWGANVQDSMRFLEESHCAPHVRWVSPLGTVAFEKMTKACDVVVDQFLLGSFGGILFKAMATGAAVCTYLNEEEMKKIYATCPPVINCRTEQEIMEKMREVIRHPQVLRDLATASRQWIKFHYASSETIAKQVERYREFLDKPLHDKYKARLER